MFWLLAILGRSIDLIQLLGLISGLCVSALNNSREGKGIVTDLPQGLADGELDASTDEFELLSYGKSSSI